MKRIKHSLRISDDQWLIPVDHLHDEKETEKEKEKNLFGINDGFSLRQSNRLLPMIYELRKTIDILMINSQSDSIKHHRLKNFAHG